MFFSHLKIKVISLFFISLLAGCMYTPTNEFGEKIDINTDTPYDQYQYSQSSIKGKPNLSVVRANVKMLILNKEKNKILSFIDTGDIFDPALPHYSIDIKNRNVSRQTFRYSSLTGKPFRIIINAYVYAQINSEQKNLSKVMFDSLRDKKSFDLPNYPECVNLCKERPNIVPNDIYTYYINDIVNDAVEQYFSNEKNRNVEKSTIYGLFEFISDMVEESETPINITNIKFSHLFVTEDGEDEKVMTYFPEN